MSISIDQIIRSNRKSIGLEISPDARLIVRVPFFTPKKVLDRVIIEKSNWILKKQQLARERARQITRKKFIEGEPFLYLGQRFPLTITDHQSPALSFDGNTFSLRKKGLARAEALFVNWYQKRAKEIYGERISQHEKASGIVSNELRISSAQKRWGSCNPRGNLHINWRLIMAPLAIIDYVIVHELVHIEENNHGKKFWKRVAALCTDYRSSRKWLRDNGHLLTL